MTYNLSINKIYTKLYFINMAIKITKEKSNSKGSSLCEFLNEINFLDFLDTNYIHLINFNYNDDKEDINKLKEIIVKVRKKLKNGKSFDEIIDVFLNEVNNKNLKNKIINVIEDVSIIGLGLFNKDFLSKNLSDKVDKIKNDIGLIFNSKNSPNNISIEEINNILIEKNNLLKILNHNENNILSVLIDTLKIKNHNNYKNYLQSIVNKDEELKLKIIAGKNQMMHINNDFFSSKIQFLTDDSHKGISYLSELMLYIKDFEKNNDLLNNIKLSFINKRGITRYYAVEIMIAILKEEQKNSNKEILSLKKKILNYFIKNDKRVFTTLLARLSEDSRIKDIKDFIDHYSYHNNINDEDKSKFLLTKTIYKNEKSLIEYIYSKYEKNLEYIEFNQNNKKVCDYKSYINDNIINFVSDYSQNNYLLLNYQNS